VTIYRVEVLKTGMATRMVFVGMLFCHAMYFTRSVNVHFIPETIMDNASLEVVTSPPSVGYYSVAETCTPEPGGSMMCNGVVWDSTTSVNFTKIKLHNPLHSLSMTLPCFQVPTTPPHGLTQGVHHCSISFSCCYYP
jgi:hypothetical protein